MLSASLGSLDCQPPEFVGSAPPLFCEWIMLCVSIVVQVCSPSCVFLPDLLKPGHWSYLRKTLLQCRKRLWLAHVYRCHGRSPQFATDGALSIMTQSVLCDPSLGKSAFCFVCIRVCVDVCARALSAVATSTFRAAVAGMAILVRWSLQMQHQLFW